MIAGEPTFTGGPDLRASASDVSGDSASSSSTSPQTSIMSSMRRNESAAAQLQSVTGKQQSSAGAPAPTLAGKKNKSHASLSELGRQERSDPSREGNRQLVIEAVVMQLLCHKGGTVTEEPDLSKAMHKYIEAIVRQLDLPNSCIIAALIYIQRAIASGRFTLTDNNWQPCLLASFVVGAKLSFDEPVWNEDFAKALQISNIPVSQISRWEASFLQLIDFDTNVDLQEYAACCFQLQQQFQAQRGELKKLFTYLMLQARARPAPAHLNRPVARPSPAVRPLCTPLQAQRLASDDKKGALPKDAPADAPDKR